MAVPRRTAAAAVLLVSVSVAALLLRRSAAYQYKVGDLDAWGLPPSTDPTVYTSWAQSHKFQLGDSLLFLYPPSQDSVVQVTEQAFNSCKTADPIGAAMDDGSSVFKLTRPGYCYFISGAAGRCEKGEKLRIFVSGVNGSFFPAPDAPGPSGAGAGGLDGAPSSPLAFGPSSSPPPAPAQGGGTAAAIRAPAALAAAAAGGLFFLLISP